MNTTFVRPTLKVVRRVILGLSIAAGLAAGSPAIAAGHGGGGHGGGGHMGGGGHIGGGGFRGGGYGWGRGGFTGGGRYYRGGYGYGGYGGFYPGLYGLGALGLGYGLGYGYGYPGYGYGYPGYGLGYSGYAYGSYPGSTYGSGYHDPSYSYSNGTGYVYPGSSNVVSSYSDTGYLGAPNSGYTYSSAYGTVPLQATTSGAVSTWPLPTLGIDEQEMSDATGKQIAVTRVHPGTPAERAGLQVGDTIVSANGFLTQVPGNLAWIINHHAPNGVITLNVRKAATGQNATVSARLH